MVVGVIIPVLGMEIIVTEVPVLTKKPMMVKITR